jgi:hypothetical protein
MAPARSGDRRCREARELEVSVMPVFDRVRGLGSQKKPAKVERLVAALAEAKPGGNWDNHMGFDADASIIEQLEQLGDPAAVPALVAKRTELQEYLVFMKTFALQDAPSQELYRFVSDLLETTTRVAWALRGDGPAEPPGAGTESRVPPGA